MKFARYTLLLLYASFGCSSVIQLPQRQVAEPTEKNLYLGNQYKNQDEEGEQRTLDTADIYFNYEDFRDLRPRGRIIVEKPFDTIKDLKNVPSQAKVGLYHELAIDSSRVEFLSDVLWKTKRPKLNQQFTGRETYRLILHHSYQDDYIIELYEDGNQATIETIKIENNSRTFEVTKKNIPSKQLKKFKKLLINGNFWALQPYQWVTQVDGSRWTIEAHTHLGYKVLSRSSPGLIYEDELLLRQAGQWLINKGAASNIVR